MHEKETISTLHFLCYKMFTNNLSIELYKKDGALLYPKPY